MKFTKIKFWITHLNWFIPFISELYPLTKFQLLQYEELWDWERIQRNPFIKWNKEMKEYFTHNFTSPIMFPIKQINISLINPEYYFQFFHNIPTITCDNIYMKERDEGLFEMKIEWKDILFGNYKIPEVNEKSLMQVIEKFDCGINLSGNLLKDMPIPSMFLEKNKDDINWKEISNYPGLMWSFELLRKFEDYWVTEQLICNHTAFNYCLKDDLDDEFIEKVLS